MSIKQEYEDYAARREALAKTHFGPIWLNPLDRYVHPFRIWGNVWYVGDSWVCVHLIDTGDGLLLIDSGNCGCTDMLVQAIWEAGFNPKDVKWIIHSHGHLDHIGGATRAEFETVVQLLNPFAPHMTEELWEKLGHSHDEQLAYYPWPKYEEAKCVESTVEIAVQVNGKVKARLKVAADITSEDAIAAAKADPAVAEALSGKTVVKEIYVKGRLVNLAVKG